MIAIQTKYLPATGTRGVRIKAYTCNSQSLTDSRKYNLEIDQDCKRVALLLCKKMGWSENIEGGATKEGYTFIFLRSEK